MSYIQIFFYLTHKANLVKYCLILVNEFGIMITFYMYTLNLSEVDNYPYICLIGYQFEFLDMVIFARYLDFYKVKNFCYFYFSTLNQLLILKCLTDLKVVDNFNQLFSKTQFEFNLKYFQFTLTLV